MVTIDCTILNCLPVEMYLGMIGVSIAFGIFGFMRTPQVPAMLMLGGIFIFVLGAMFNGVLLGVVPETSTVAGATTTYAMENNGFDMSGLPQVLIILTGASLMLVSGIMVSKK